jgi:DeoR/GlpR family transcriptional regulator of sugar metabolism
MTIAELAKSAGVTTRSIERNLQKLQDEGKVRRVGADKGGFWEVLK